MNSPKNIIAIGDPHGSYKTLLKLIEQFPKDATVVILGDTIDRGPRSAQVVKYIRQNKILCVKGNHEDLMVKAVRNGAEFEWKMNGGDKTTKSYEDLYEESAYKKMASDVQWMEDLPLYLEFTFPGAKREKLFLSHAGVYNTGNDDFQQSLEFCVRNQDIMWHRDQLFDEPNTFQIVGHTPQKNGPSIHMDSAYIDTGACYTGRPDYGRLTAISYPDLVLYTQNNID